MVGFNRRFSKFAEEIRKHTSLRTSPLFIRYRMNAGFIPLDSWHHEHGGRIVGEGCHIVDFISSLTDSRVKSVHAQKLNTRDSKYSRQDNVSILMNYEDGSVASIDYIATGSKSLEKEFCEVHFDGKSIVLEDYKSLKGFGLKVKEFNYKSNRKGQYEEMLALYDCLTDSEKTFPISLDSIFETTQITLEVAKLEE